jgi:SSS family solute:Na+ symporter
MRYLDWLVLVSTIGFIVFYGVWKTRGSKNINDFLLADKSMKWWTICLSIMATQASAITFLSTPGQAFEDGMGFIQFYFGLPIAMVILSITAVPIYAKLKVFTAYQYLETRFDLKTRTLAALLFLIQRGLAAGITIYAPSIVLSALLGWDLTYLIYGIGLLVIIYTVSGGSKAVSVTQKHQMAVMMGGMIAVGVMVYLNLPKDISFYDSIRVAGKMGKMDMVDFSFDINDRYNFWAGITGGLFLALSYFGTDQSQVSRYLSGKSVKESRMGLLFNGLLKIPMQFMILFIGVLVYLFYQFQAPPVFFNQQVLEQSYTTSAKDRIHELENAHQEVFLERKEHVHELVAAIQSDNQKEIENIQSKLDVLTSRSAEIKKDVQAEIAQALPNAQTKDTDYVFLSFVMKYMPVGIVGLLLAVILSASMSSTASELNALAATTTVDLYKRSIYDKGSDTHYLNSSRLFTLLWGVLAIIFALSASLFENLIQLVNLIGSLFYGAILGIFLVAFYIKYIKSNAVFWAAIIAEIGVLSCYAFTDIGFLWFNVIGCLLVVIIGFIFQVMDQLLLKKAN